jgi:murein DD-endopeptidase MepM/ murein hydrolase activator NlpD
VESGYVEALGWNQYGGWRIGIRSFDKKRYYYYAHLRKNFPYRKDLAVGSIVQAGDVIGYLGRTGYSSNENANNIRTPHLHFGLQLIFDESQKESNNEIWVDCYDLIQFLYRNRCETSKNQETKEYTRVYQYIDPIAEYYIHHSIYRYDDDEFDIRIYD